VPFVHLRQAARAYSWSIIRSLRCLGTLRFEIVEPKYSLSSVDFAENCVLDCRCKRLVFGTVKDEVASYLSFDFPISVMHEL
jgi:hypothetical protein